MEVESKFISSQKNIYKQNTKDITIDISLFKSFQKEH